MVIVQMARSAVITSTMLSVEISKHWYLRYNRLLDRI